MPVDPNKVRLTGENSFLGLAESPDEEPTAQNSHWRILLSPKGAGHVLFTKGQLTDNEPRIYSDNPALARWLQEGIQASMSDTFSGEDIPVIEAEFWKEGSTFSYWSENVRSHEDLLTLTWWDFGDPVIVANAPRERPSQPHGVYSILVPAGRAQMTLNGDTAAGKAHPRPFDGETTISTCCLALSETWTIPPDDETAQERVCG
jgi:hypothetical protein